MENDSLIIEIYGRRIDLFEREYDFEHEWGQIPAGRYTIFWNLLEDWGRIFPHRQYTGELEVEPADEIRINLRPGWNLIGIPLTHNLTIRQLFSPLVDAGILRIAKEGGGRYYLPSQDFCNMEAFNPRTGYLLNVTEDAVFEVEGHFVDPDSEVPLAEGWNQVAYLPENEAEAPTAFRDLGDNLLVAKNGWGNFYLPIINYNGLPPLQRGQGFMVKVQEQEILIWRDR